MHRLRIAREGSTAGRFGGALAVAVAGLLVCAGAASADTATFAFTGGEQTFTVPLGVSSLQIAAIGGHGGERQGSPGGRGASVSGTVAVAPGQVLYVEVGGSGADALAGGGGGFNGGGSGDGGGGGASDVRTAPMSAGATSLSLRVIVAGGGGGAGGFAGGDAGSAGSGGADAGGAGTQTMPGAGGDASGASPGSPGTLGAGGKAATSSGGGGGGLFGGGGGGFNGTGGGGGGGSSLVPPGGASSLAAVGAATLVQINYTPPAPPPPDTTPAALTSYRVSASTFRAANIGGSIVRSAARRKPPVGTTVRYALSERATVKFTVEAAAAGRRVKGKCVTPTRANGKKPRCTRYRPLRGSFTQAGSRGRNKLTFSGRLNSKALKAGNYRLVATATDAARNVSKSKRVNFKIVTH